MYDENDENLVILLDEDGEEHPFECLDIIEMDGNTYACLVPYMEEIEDEDEMMEVVIMKVAEDENGEEVLEMIDSEEELDQVFAIFKTHVDEDEFEVED